MITFLIVIVLVMDDVSYNLVLFKALVTKVRVLKLKFFFSLSM